MAETKSKLGRRNFLLAVGASGAAAAAAVVAPVVSQGPLQSQAPASGNGKRSTKGYAVSEHINNYYRTTKV